jgi:hypothetical protein
MVGSSSQVCGACFYNTPVAQWLRSAPPFGWAALYLFLCANLYASSDLQKSDARGTVSAARCMREFGGGRQGRRP